MSPPAAILSRPRVISLLPSATEVLCIIGGEPLLVGRSHECDSPVSVRALPVLTAQRTPDNADSASIDRAVRESLASGQSLYTVDDALLKRLRPDLVLTQNLCSVCSIDLAHVQRVAHTMRADDGSPVRIVSLDPHTVEDVIDTLLIVGEATGLAASATAAAVRLREHLFSTMEYVNPFESRGNVLFLEWTDPMFCAGHWTVQLIERAGGLHPLNPTAIKPGHGAAAGPQHGEQVAGPSRTITPEEALASDPQWLVVCPCGFDLERSTAAAKAFLSQPWTRSLPAVRANRIAAVDGNLHFNRPGPRLVEAFDWLVGWLNDRPSLIPPDFAWKAL